MKIPLPFPALNTPALGFWQVIAQKASDSAYHTHIQCPAYYPALHAQQLEMMYLLIEPLFEQAEAFKAQWVSDGEIADIITRMIQ